MSDAVIDQDVRDEALDLSRSFLVQAPAGSGKTELLIQRFLALLAIVAEPEEIRAVTFTRKAAAEMRSRIFDALAHAKQGKEPPETHLRRGYELACLALERDRERGWSLLTQPSRLRIETIDAMNSWLCSRAPISAGHAAQLRVVKTPLDHCREAARRTIALLEPGDPIGEAVEVLLEHCDNRAERLEDLLSKMLLRRDQWLRQTGAGPGADTSGLRAGLEANIALVVDNALGIAASVIGERLSHELAELLPAAAERLRDGAGGQSLAAWAGRRGFPQPVAADLPAWRGLAEVLLTKDRKWRTAIDVRLGFPPDEPEAKRRIRAVIAELRGGDGALDALSALRGLPDPVYDDRQWHVLEALLRLLPVAAAVLKQLLAERGETDFSEIAQQALAALGGDDDPTELQMILDYRLSHILLDEFQDTSRSQFELLRRLTAGWTRDDGRTLFLVGDPMQSIYRFREAEVGLYLEARHKGLGTVTLDFLRLRTNFRSDPAIVDWVNGVFDRTLPAREDAITGAVPFAPGTAFHAPDAGAGVSWHIVPDGEDRGEAAEVVHVVEHCLRRWPADSVAILVRSRRHAAEIAPALRAAGVAFSGAEMETLEQQPAVQDLLALTRALAHPGDRLAWLAVLRAPWCGLSLADLHALAGRDHDAAVPDLLLTAEATGRLSADGRQRAARLTGSLFGGPDRRGRLTLRDRVEQAWLSLGGPATLADASNEDFVDKFLELLDTVQVGEDLVDGEDLRSRLSEEKVSRLTDGQVQVMTMHKAKGLEFDTVILPGLARRGRGDEQPLLLWQELAIAGDTAPLVMAPASAAGRVKDPLFELLWNVRRRQAEMELDRLLYVSATRARKRLHLFAGLRTDADDNIAPPDTRSLLARIWPAVSKEIRVPQALQLPAPQRRRAGRTPPRWEIVPIRRLAAGWNPPDPPESVRPRAHPAAEPDRERLEFDWASRWAMHVGTVVHRWLQEIAATGAGDFDAARIRGLNTAFRLQLTRLGVQADELDKAAERVERALVATLADERGRWILSGMHDAAENELELTVDGQSGFEKVVVDRTFVASGGERWIIDYKISSHAGGGLDEFLKSEELRYAPQLRRYRDALAVIDDRPVRTALYFPLLQIFREVIVPNGAGPVSD